MAVPDASSPPTRDNFSSTGIAPEWVDENQRGIALFQSASWSDAVTAFSNAAETLAARQQRDPSAHHGLSLVLSNLAQACFRAGRADEAIQHAQRACAMRVALSGEDAVTTARARSDLAVLLASAGRADEAPALIGRAISGVEQSVGDEDPCLAPLLENAARVSLALAQPANAEPHLLRLHALLAAHDRPTDRADALLTRVLEARHVAAVKAEIEQQHGFAPSENEPHREQPAARQLEERVPEERVPEERVPEEQRQSPQLFDVGAVSAEPAISPLVDDAAEWEDQPLRDAVLLTDTLLRTTPTGVPVIRDRQDALETMPLGVTASAQKPEAAELQPEPADDWPADAMMGVAPDDEVDATASAEGAHATDTTSGADAPDAVRADGDAGKQERAEPFDATNIEFTDDAREVAPATDDAEPGPTQPASTGADVNAYTPESAAENAGGLGFVVSYGVPLEADPVVSGALPERAAPSAESATPDAPGEQELELVPQSSLAPDVSASITQEIVLTTPPPGVPVTRVPESIPVSLQPVAERPDRVPENHPPARPTVHSLNAVPVEEPRRRTPTPRIAGARRTPKKSRAPIIGGIGAIILAIAGWYFTRGMF